MAMGPAGSVTGSIFKYGPGSIHTAFITGPGRLHAVFIPGLTDGLLSHSYFKPLGAALEATRDWSLVQPLLTSSYTGWGMASLEQDTDEIALLAKHLAEHWQSRGIILIGHSTGCQDAVRYAKRFQDGADGTPPLLGVALQGAVSDREFMMTDPSMVNLIPQAKEMVSNGRGEDVLARDIFLEGVPSFMSARRFLSLIEKGGEDDMFSSDLSDEELADRLGHLYGIPTLIMVSGADEYIPTGIDAAVLGQRLAGAIGGPASSSVVVAGDANHSLTGYEREAVALLLEFACNCS